MEFYCLVSGRRSLTILEVLNGMNLMECSAHITCKKTVRSDVKFYK